MAQGSKILLVDDDRALTEMLSELLQTEGYECTAAASGSEGLLKEREEKPDLVILDVMMPGDDGISTLRKLRETSEVAVLMLTAMGEDDDRVLGLEAGADDYLAKPFVARELVLRIQAILRRLARAKPVEAGLKIQAGPLKIEPSKERAQLDGAILPLTGAELRILESLASTPGEIVSREELTQIALGRELSPYDRALDTHVSHLRNKLGKAGDSPVAIRSVRGAGYRLVID
ncbi:MAG: response regulator transcription factor [Gammaproteobacteria bacterium]|nr:response regulator transcription factor [Gammaproteobacteria bacterium]MBT8110503.1 response regulator transcription factor [Gammaproteobacteria bacterium]NND46401.1 response regulator transcription factor [Woeseiaceae bacterium]NNL45203.1 response regulator transcription factor [Woeseiaceae bacterium]